MTPRFALRSATADDHHRVDDIFSRFRIADQGGYRAFLTATAAAHLPVERALDAARAERVIADWPQRRRSAFILRDLEALGGREPASERRWSFSDEGSMLGALYVLEGSRLGGGVLRRELGEAMPQSFLGAPSSAGSWRRLIQFLDRQLADSQKLAAAISTARQVFASFAAAGVAELEPVS